MGMNRKYSGFTLVEMLIVMGIIIILMAVGIAAGRFAINRANDVAHQNAADQIFTAAQAHLTDYREYPTLTDASFTAAMNCEGVTGCIGDYLTSGEFRGGTDSTYYYWTNSAQSAALACVSLGGHSDEGARGYYCTGNGFGDPELASAISSKDLPANETGFPGDMTTGWQVVENWNNATNSF